MSITIQLYYHGQHGSAQKFAQTMVKRGVVEKIRQEPGNRKYEYYQSLSDPETLLLVDEWENQAALDAHHQSPMMDEIAQLRSQYDLHMEVVKLTPFDNDSSSDDRFIRK
jgi:quinol monooxygenase YgiN